MKMLLQTRFLSPVQHTLLVFSPILIKPTFRITVRSQKASSESSSDDSTPKGFGLSDTATTANSKKKQKQKQKGQRERASVIRRNPVEKPAFVSEEQEGKARKRARTKALFFLQCSVLASSFSLRALVSQHLVSYLLFTLYY